jgi:hypothetical protein
VKIDLNRDWSEFLHALISRRVRFVLVGGHAVAGHGEPRLTEDLDVLVEPTLANARRLREALVDFGFGALAFRGGARNAGPDFHAGAQAVAHRRADGYRRRDIPRSMGESGASGVRHGASICHRPQRADCQQACRRARQDLLDVALLERHGSGGARRRTRPKRKKG